MLTPRVQSAMQNLDRLLEQAERWVEAFNPDQPRDEHGKFISGAGGVSLELSKVFKAVPLSVIGRIKDEGLKRGIPFYGRPQSVYFTRAEAEAKDFGKRLAKTSGTRRFAIVEFGLSAEMLGDAIQDELGIEQGFSTAFRIESDIPSDSILSVTTYLIRDSGEVQQTFGEKSKSSFKSRGYSVILIKDDKTEEKAMREVASVSDVARGYESDLGDLVQALLRGGHRLSKADFRRDMRKAVKDWAKQMFEVAWEDGGGDLDETESDDLALMEEFVSEQQSFVSAFADWLTAKESDLDVVPDRLALWAASLENFGGQLKARAMGNPRLTLKLRPGAKRAKEPCDTCNELESQTHTLAWWRGKNPDGADYTKRNGNDAYLCGHWDEACFHSLFHAKTGEMVIP